MRVATISLVAAVASCVHGGEGTPDAAATMNDAAQTGMVTIRVLDRSGDGSPAAGVPVVFIDANGTQKLSTAADGRVSASVLAGASVTAILAGNPTFVESILDIEPGDDLILGEDNAAPDPSEGSFTVNFKAVPGDAYDVYGPCGDSHVGSGSGSSAPLLTNQSCMQTPMDLLLVESDGSGQPIGYVEAPDTSFADGGNTVISGQMAAMSAFNANYTDLGGISSVDVTRFAPDALGYQAENIGSVTGTELPLALTVPIAGRALVDSTFVHAGTSNSQTVRQSIAGDAMAFGLDAGTTLIGWVGLPSLDVATNQATIPFDQTGTSSDDPDLTFVDFLVTRPTPGGAATEFLWVVFQAKPAGFTLPQIPPELGNVNPGGTDTVTEAFGGTLESDGLNGYADARKDPLKTVDSFFGSVAEHLPMNTTRVRISRSPQTNFKKRGLLHMSRR